MTVKIYVQNICHNSLKNYKTGHKFAFKLPSDQEKDVDFKICGVQVV